MVIAEQTTVEPKTQDLTDRLGGDHIKGLQRIVTRKIVNVFKANGKKIPKLIVKKRFDEDYGYPFTYLIIGLTPPYAIGGQSLIAELDSSRIMKPDSGEIAVFAKMPGSDGYKPLPLNQIADGIIEAYGRTKFHL